MKWRKRSIALLLPFYVFFWLGGVISHTFLGGPPPHVAWAAPLFLGLAGAVVLLASNAQTLMRLCVAGAIGIAAEFIGVHTGVPFGGYRYTAALYPLVFGIPVVMTSAWLILVAHWNQVLQRFSLSRARHVLALATLLTYTDLIIDPLAAGPLGYWEWVAPGHYYGIPLSNFVGWFVVSFLIGVSTAPETARNGMHLFVGVSVIAFFTILALTHGMWLAGALGIIAVALSVAGWRAQRA